MSSSNQTMDIMLFSSLTATSSSTDPNISYPGMHSGPQIVSMTSVTTRFWSINWMAMLLSTITVWSLHLMLFGALELTMGLNAMGLSCKTMEILFSTMGALPYGHLKLMRDFHSLYFIYPLNNLFHSKLNKMKQLLQFFWKNLIISRKTFFNDDFPKTTWRALK